MGKLVILSTDDIEASKLTEITKKISDQIEVIKIAPEEISNYVTENCSIIFECGHESFDIYKKLVEQNPAQLDRTIAFVLPKKRSDCFLVEELGTLRQEIWNVFNYSSFLAVLLDRDYNIRLCNRALAQFLGFDNEFIPLQRNWLDFISPAYHELTKCVHDELIKGNEKKKFLEYTTSLKTPTDQVLVKWFHSPVNNQGFEAVFSVGIPLSKEISPEENIENIRAYWRDIVKKDRAAIRSIRDLVADEDHRM